jgi:histidinol-phosphate aminotransferase
MIKGLNYKEEELDVNFTFDPNTVLKNTKKDTGSIVVCNPNNPTGNQFPRESVISLIDSFEGIVILDEAYTEYGEYSLANEAEKRENLIVLRTFSKAYGLAGLRLGYAVTNKEFASIINERYMMPYPVSSLALMIGLKALQNQKIIKENIIHTKKTRDTLIEELNRINGVKAFKSDANFVLFTVNKPMDIIYQALVKKGIIVRKIGAVPGYTECLRVTVAPTSMSKRFIVALKEVLK